MKNWDTVFSLVILIALCLLTYKTQDGFYAVLSFIVAWYLLYKIREQASSWLDKTEEK